MAEGGSLFIDATFPAGAPPGENGNLNVPLQEDSEQLNLWSDIAMTEKAILKQNSMSNTNMTTLVEYVDNLVGNQKALLDWEKGDKGYNTGLGKKRQKIEDYMMKKMVAADFFTKASGFLKGIWNSSKNLLFDILKFLLIFSLFGPEFLDAIIGFVVQFAIMLVNAFIKAIPLIVDAIIKWGPLIAKALWEAFIALAGALGTAILNIIEKVFGIKLDAGPLRTFLKMLFGIVPIILFVLSKLNLLRSAFSLMGLLFKGVAAIVGALSGPVLLIIGAIAAVVAIFIYAEEIVSFFEKGFKNFWEWFKKQGTGMKVLLIGLGVVLGLLFSPIIALIGLVYGLAKLFSFLKGVNWGNVWGGIKEGFSKSVEYLGDAASAVGKFAEGTYDTLSSWGNSIKVFFTTKVMGVIRRALDYIKAEIRRQIMAWIDIFKTVFSIGGRLFNTIVDGIKSMLKSLIDGIFGEGTFDNLIKRFKAFFNNLIDWITAVMFIMSHPLQFVTGNAKVEDIMSAAVVSRTQGRSIAGVVNAELIRRGENAAFSESNATEQRKAMEDQNKTLADLRNRTVEQTGTLKEMAEAIKRREAPPPFFGAPVRASNPALGQ